MSKDKFSDYDSTAGNNTDIGGINIQGTAVVQNFDNALRELMAQTADHFASATVASSATVNLGSQSAHYITITGTTTITSFGTVKAGTLKFVRFSGALTLTHNATSLILPGSANITTAAGDTAILVSEGSGNWRCIDYRKSAIPPGSVLNSVVKVMTSDQTSTSTLLANVTDLTFEVKTGETWVFEANVIASMSNDPADCEIAFNGPTASSFSWTRCESRNSNTNAVGLTSITAYDTTVRAAAQNTRSWVTVSGRATFTSSGTFATRIRRSAPAGTATFLENSTLKAWRIA